MLLQKQGFQSIKVNVYKRWFPKSSQKIDQSYAIVWLHVCLWKYFTHLTLRYQFHCVQWSTTNVNGGGNRLHIKAVIRTIQVGYVWMKCWKNSLFWRHSDSGEQHNKNCVQIINARNLLSPVSSPFACIAIIAALSNKIICFIWQCRSPISECLTQVHRKIEKDLQNKWSWPLL